MSEIKALPKRFIKSSARSLFEYFTLKTRPYSDSYSRENKTDLKLKALYCCIFNLEYLCTLSFLMLYKYSVFYMQKYV